MKILSLDPGGTTGFCFITAPYHLKEYGEIKDITSEDLQEMISRCDMVVAEDFRIAPSRARALSWRRPVAIEILTLAEEICRQTDKEIILQQPGVANFWTAKKLDWMGFLDKDYPHAMDALKHGLYYLAFDSDEFEDDFHTLLGGYLDGIREKTVRENSL